MMLAARLFHILYRELSARPLLAFTTSYLLASFITAYASEKKRLDALIADTVRDMHARSEEIEQRIAYGKVGEEFAPFDEARWRKDGDIAKRLYGDAPVELAR